jgi:two-component system LytT family response regulator
MNMRAVIIDDEIRVAETLKNIIENNVHDVDVVATICEPLMAPGLVYQCKPDVVFIDIEMPGMNGFDVLDSIDDIDFKIIFVTAYDQYALRAIKASAMDYILKPIEISDVVQAVAKVRHSISVKTKIDKHQLSYIKNSHNYSEIIKIPTLAGIDFLDISEIIRVEASGNYCEIYCQDRNHIMMTRSIREAEKLLDHGVFYRSHRSHIINIRHIKRYVYSSGGIIIMSDGKEIPLSRRKKNEFNELINSVSI